MNANDDFVSFDHASPYLFSSQISFFQIDISCASPFARESDRIRTNRINTRTFTNNVFFPSLLVDVLIVPYFNIYSSTLTSQNFFANFSIGLHPQLSSTEPPLETSLLGYWSSISTKLLICLRLFIPLIIIHL